MTTLTFHPVDWYEITIEILDVEVSIDEGCTVTTDVNFNHVR